MCPTSRVCRRPPSRLRRFGETSRRNSPEFHASVGGWLGVRDDLRNWLIAASVTCRRRPFRDAVHNVNRLATSLLRLPHCHKSHAVVETRERTLRIVLVSFVSVSDRSSQIALDQLLESTHLPVNRLIRIVLILEGVRHEDAPMCKRLHRSKRSSAQFQEVVVVLREPAGAAPYVHIKKHSWSREQCVDGEQTAQRLTQQNFWLRQCGRSSRCRG